MLLNGKCSWSYKSLKTEDKNKKDEKSSNSFFCIKNPNITEALFSENNAEVYNFEAPPSKKKSSSKVFSKDHFESPGIQKDDIWNDYNEFDLSKKTKKGRKKQIKRNKNINNLHESPRKTSLTLRNKKRINYADTDEDFDLKLDQDEDYTIQTMLKKTRSHQSNTSRDSEYSDDEGLVFQTRYSDKNANVLEIANTIESDSNYLFENLEERGKTTITPTILKLNESLTSKSIEQTFSDNLAYNVGESSQINSQDIFEKSESSSSDLSKSENSLNYNPEEGNSETNRKCFTPKEFDIDIGAEIFKKCQEVCADIQSKYDDFTLEKNSDDLEEEIITMSESYHTPEKVEENKSTKENTCEKMNIKRQVNSVKNKNGGKLPKNKKRTNIKKKLTKKKSVNQKFGMQASSSISDFNEDIFDVKTMKKCKQPDLGTESVTDEEKRRIIENDLGLDQNTEIKEEMSVKDFTEWQSSNEEENSDNQSTLKKEMFFKKIESSLNWDKTLDTQMECNIPTSSLDQKEIKLKNLSEKTLSLNNNTWKTNSVTSKHNFQKSPSFYSEGSDNISENDVGKDSFQIQRFEKTKNISPNIDLLDMIENESSNFTGHSEDPVISTNQQGIFLKKEDINQIKLKQINEKKNLRNEKLIDATQESYMKIRSFNISKDADFKKKTFKNNEVRNKISTKSNPKTWEDLETRLLSETGSNCYEISENSYQDIENRDNLWNKNKEFETRTITKEFFQIGSKEIKKNLCLNKFENKHRNSDCTHVLPIIKSPNLNIINKAIQAMEKCTTGYVSPFKSDFINNLEEYEENDDLNEYSISVHSTIIRSSRNNLSTTNTFFQRTGKIDKKAKKLKNSLKNQIIKENSIEKNSKTPTAKINVQKSKKLTSSKPPNNYIEQNTMHIIGSNTKFEKFAYQDASDDSTNYNSEKYKNSDSYSKDFCTLYNSTIFPDEINSDKSKQNFNPNKTKVENSYNFRKRKVKSSLENQLVKFKTKCIPETLQNSSNQDAVSYGIDLNPLNSAQLNDKVTLKRNLDSSNDNLSKKIKFEDYNDSSTCSHFSFNHTDENMGLFDSLDVESNVERKTNKGKSFKKQNTTLNIQVPSNLEANINLKIDNMELENCTNLKSKDETHKIVKNISKTKSDFNLTPINDKCKIKQIKKANDKENTTKKYKEYLKKLFQSENASFDENTVNGKDGSTEDCSKHSLKRNDEIKDSKIMIKEDDELFSISSEDSESNEKGVNSEVDSGLFFDVLD